MSLNHTATLEKYVWFINNYTPTSNRSFLSKISDLFRFFTFDTVGHDILI